MQSAPLGSTSLAAMLALALSWPGEGQARDGFENLVPNGNTNLCLTCHDDPRHGGPPNVFGQEFQAQGRRWSASIAELDSDGDGFTNGVELQDPAGAWRQGAAAPGNSALVTRPGDPNSHPELDPPAEGEGEGEGEPPAEGEGEEGEGEGEGEDPNGCPNVPIGEPCGEDAHCGSAGRCLIDLLGGYCTIVGEEGDPEICCPTGSRPADLPGRGTLCLAACGSDDDCRTADAHFCDIDEVCWSCVIPDAERVGSRCAIDDDCGRSGVCLKTVGELAFPDGYCSVDPNPWCCPSGSHTVELPVAGAVVERCLRSCTDDARCGRDGYICAPGSGACVPDADASEEPPPPEDDPSDDDSGLCQAAQVSSMPPLRTFMRR